MTIGRTFGSVLRRFGAWGIRVVDFLSRPLHLETTHPPAEQLTAYLLVSHLPAVSQHGGHFPASSCVGFYLERATYRVVGDSWFCQMNEMQQNTARVSALDGAKRRVGGAVL